MEHGFLIGMKPWYASRTVWAGILQVLLGIAVSFGLMNEDQAIGVLSTFPDTIVGIISMILGITTITTRVVAVNKIG